MRLRVLVDITVPDQFPHLCVVNSDAKNICAHYTAVCENGYCGLYKKYLRFVGIGKKRKGIWDNEGIKRCKDCLKNAIQPGPSRVCSIIRGGAYNEPDQQDWSQVCGQGRSNSVINRTDPDQGFRCIK